MQQSIVIEKIQQNIIKIITTRFNTLIIHIQYVKPLSPQKMKILVKQIKFIKKEHCIFRLKFYPRLDNFT